MAVGAELGCHDSKGAVLGRSTNGAVCRSIGDPHRRTRCESILGYEGLGRAVTRRNRVLMVRLKSRRGSTLESLQIAPDALGETIPERIGNERVSNRYLK